MNVKDSKAQAKRARKGKRKAQREIVQSPSKNVRFHSRDKGTEKAQAHVEIQKIHCKVQRKNDLNVSISKSQACTGFFGI